MSLIKKITTKVETLYQKTPMYKYGKQMENRYSQTAEGAGAMKKAKELSSTSVFSKKFWKDLKSFIKTK
jgi:hypothetical protein